MNGEESIHSDELKTPINNWRLILERLTGKPIESEAHKAYIYKDYAALYDFRKLNAELFK